MKKNQHFEVAVVGLGAMGLFALDVAARRGLNAIGIDQFNPPHDQGSTHGETRLIREAYSEDPAYIPLLRRSMELWRDHSKSMTGDVFFETGVQYFGPEEHPSVLATRKAAQLYDIPLVEMASGTETTPFHVPDSWDFFHETRAGYLNVENVLSQLISSSKTNGATCLTDHRIQSLKHNETGWVIRAGDQTITADRAIFALGSWVHKIIPALQPYLTLERHTLHWFQAPGDESFAVENGFQPFVAHLPNNDWFYGFPMNKDRLVKIAEHNTGKQFSNWEDMDRVISDEDRTNVASFCAEFAPSLGDIKKSVSCMYTMSPDGDFILDYHPQSSTASIAAGLSGHGYKFAPAIGEALVDMIQGQETKTDLSIFSLKRFEQ